MNKKNVFCIIFSFLMLFALIACAQTEKNKKGTSLITKKKTIYIPFSRDNIVQNLKEKISRSEPLFIHVFVPLCDNDHQGIVKVGWKLGEGRNLKTNLYWGAGYGLKTWFSRSKQWKLIKNFYFKDSSILERVIYYRVYPNHSKVYLILDGYAGDKMENCLNNYFKSLAGICCDYTEIDSVKIGLYGKSDFLIFNGHNGLMDVECPIYYNVDKVEKDAAVIACASWYYLMERFQKLKAYPLLTTTQLLPPEAYVVSAVIDNWANMQSDEVIWKSAGEAMAKYHKKALKPCVNLFTTGWKIKTYE